MRWLLALIVQFAWFAAVAQDTVHFPSFDPGDGHRATELTANLFKPNRPGPMPALVFLHGCSGLVSSISHRIMSREMDWAGRLTGQGYAVLMVDSFTPRGSGQECSRSGFKEWVHLRRPGDAYAGLAWLQQQPFVAKDRITEIDWSNGGG
jgi:dienelactone hydrolase